MTTTQHLALSENCDSTMDGNKMSLLSVPQTKWLQTIIFPSSCFQFGSNL